MKRGKMMKIVNKVSYYFDSSDKELFLDYLKILGINMKELASKLGISLSYLSSIVSGTRALSSELRRKMNEIGVII